MVEAAKADPAAADKTAPTNASQASAKLSESMCGRSLPLWTKWEDLGPGEDMQKCVASLALMHLFPGVCPRFAGRRIARTAACPLTGPYRAQISSAITGCKDHSPYTREPLESMSAPIFEDPGTCVA